MKKILMFGFEALPEILTVAGIARRCGAEAVNISRESCGVSIGELAQGRTDGAGLPVSGKMLVFCGLERELDEVLAALRREGVVCLKAVLTSANRGWTPGRLYRELERERRTMGGI